MFKIKLKLMQKQEKYPCSIEIVNPNDQNQHKQTEFLHFKVIFFHKTRVFPVQTQRREPCVEWDTFYVVFLFVYFWLSCSPVKLVTHGGDCYTTLKMNVKRLYGVRTLRGAAKRCLRH